MNREEAKELLPVMRAFIDGKEIEYYDTIRLKWLDCLQTPFFYSNTKYRVKPEREYVPFTFEDAEVFMCKPLIEEDACLTSIIAADKNEVTYVNSDGGVQVISYQTLSEDFTFLDGTPCGKLKTTNNE